MTELGMKMALAALEKARQRGLRSHFFHRLASASGGRAGSSYFGMRNSLSFLLETPGQVYGGMFFMERRVMSQYTMISTVIDYTVAHAREVMETVRASRKYMEETGAGYDENQVIVLEHEAGETGTWATPLIHVPTGEVKEEKHVIPYREHVAALRTRPRATAYLVPMSTPNEEEILRIARIHGAEGYTLPAGSAVKVRQYLQNGEKIALSEEQTVCFEQGAYVLPNTVSSTVLGAVMEPDFGNYEKMNLCTMELVNADAEGRLPIFRYCHDLVNGKVETE